MSDLSTPAALLHPTPARLLFSREEIAAAVRRLAAEISRNHRGGDVVMIGVLKGSFLFFADLVRELTIPARLDFVRLASYGSETKSSGIVEMRQDLELSIEGRDAIIVEDIVDSGHTLESLYHRLALRQPRSLSICTLIDKRERREAAIRPEYVGLVLERGFIVGYGLDHDERFRHLPDIYVLPED